MQLCHQLSEPRLLVRAVTRIDVFDERGVDVGDRDVRAVLGEHTSERKAHAAASNYGDSHMGVSCSVMQLFAGPAAPLRSSRVVPPPQPIRRGELCRAAKDTANEAAVAN